MACQALRIEVLPGDQREIRLLLSGGIQQVRVVLRALALLRLAQGMEAPQVARLLELTPQAIRKFAQRCIESGLDRALYEKQWPGASELLGNQQKQRIVAMVCGPPPEGRVRWAVRLVTERAVTRKLVPRVGRETIRILLQSHDLKPWRKKHVARNRV
jgi:putative transposase